MNEKKLTRRRALAGLGASGFAAAGLGFGGLALATEPSLAYTHSMETEVDGNDLLFEWVETYNGDTLEEATGTAEAMADPPGMTISLEDVLPGDEGALGIRMTLQSASSSSPSVTPFFAFDLYGTDENDINNPEEKAGDTSAVEGELQEYIDVKLWYDTGLMDVQPLGAANLEKNSGEPLIDDPDAEGKLADVAAHFPNSLDVDTDSSTDAGFPLDPQDGDCLTTDNAVIIAFRWAFPDSPGVNVTQSDSVSFDLHFGGEGGCG